MSKAKDGRQYRCRECQRSADQQQWAKGRKKELAYLRAGSVEPRAKVCTNCKVLKEPTEFYNSTQGKDGLHYRCKKCMDAVSKADRQTGRYKNYYRSYNQAWNLERQYGLTMFDYMRMLEAQGGLCAICQQPEMLVFKKTGEVMNLAVDHCHKTGRVRGLLCRRCNQVLGRMEDNPEWLKRMIDYLEAT